MQSFVMTSFIFAECHMRALVLSVILLNVVMLIVVTPNE
jgi:hypothetical protein